ncbi:hypothetical protein Tco_0582002 [Tanacetum coccineum]
MNCLKNNLQTVNDLSSEITQQIPTKDKERELWVELKRLFKPVDDDELWKSQRYMYDPLTWRLYDTYGVHHVSTEREHDIFMLVEKDYPLTRGLMTLMLCNNSEVDQHSEMAEGLIQKLDDLKLEVMLYLVRFQKMYSYLVKDTWGFNTSAGNSVKEILFKLNLPDHRSIFTDSKVTPTKHEQMTKPYSSPHFIANCFNARYLKMEVKCMTRSSTNKLFATFKDLEREFRSSKKHFKTLSLDELRSLDFDLFSDQEEYFEEEVAKTIAKTIEKYMSKTRADYGSRIARPKIKDKDSFELKGQFLKELCDNTFSCSDHEDANEHIEKVLEIVYLFHIPNITQDQTAANAKVAIQEMAEYSQKWHNGISRTRSTKKVYAAQVECEQFKGPQYTKDCRLKEKCKTLEEAYYTQFGAPFLGGGYRATTPGFYERNYANPSYQERR